MCWEETNRPPITLKWVDRNKGDDSHPNYRSRLVVREVKKASKSLAEFESFSAMPPLESLKVLCALMVSKRTSKRNRPYKMMLIDISRAHFYGESRGGFSVLFQKAVNKRELARSSNAQCTGRWMLPTSGNPHTYSC